MTRPSSNCENWQRTLIKPTKTSLKETIEQSGKNKSASLIFIQATTGDQHTYRPTEYQPSNFILQEPDNDPP